MILLLRHRGHFGRASGSTQLMPFLIEKQSCDGFQTRKQVGQHYQGNQVVVLGTLEHLKMCNQSEHQ